MKPTKASNYTVSGTTPTEIDTKGSFAAVKVTSGSVYAAGLDEDISASRGFLLDSGDTLCISHGIKLLAKSGSASASVSVLLFESN